MPLDHFDDSGTLAHSSTTDAVNNPTSLGFGPAWRRYILTGLYNSDFIAPPADTSSPIDNNANPLPYWNFINQSGSSVSMLSVADTTLPSGRRLDVTMGAGAANDVSLIRQFTPIPTSAAQIYNYTPALTVKTGSSVNLIEVYVNYSFYKVDGVTQTGGNNQVTKATNAIGASTVADIFLTTLPTSIPADAYYMVCDFGLRRGGGAATTDTATVSFLEARVVAANSFRRVAIPTAAQTLVAATAILANAEVVQITAAAPITLTSAPTIAAGTDGQFLTIVNTGANAITLQDQGTLPSSNLRLSAATIALGTRDNLQLVYSSSIIGWIQVGTTNVL